MPYETLTGQPSPIGDKPEIISEAVTHYNDEGDPLSEGTVYYYLCQGVKYVTKMDGCNEEDLHAQLSKWHFDN